MFPKLRPTKRIKPKAKAPPTAEERRHKDTVACMACIGCGAFGVELHHAMKVIGKVRRRDDRFIVPLCPTCHRGPKGVHGLGSEEAFEKLTGVNISAEAVKLWGDRYV